MRLSLASLGAAALLAFGPPVDAAPDASGFWDTYPDTWVATDALGRSLPTAAEVGLPRTNKTVALFYFLWLGQHGDQGPFDIAKILQSDPAAMRNPASPLWGPMHVPHHWGESIFGYYVADDEAVLAKHAQMLADAGVDVVVFDVTNQLTYPRSWRALGRVWERLRKRGIRTPQMAFLCPFWEPRKVVHELYEQLYQPGLYQDLWFRWEGRPLILADPDALSSSLVISRHDHPAALQPGHTLGQSFQATKPLLSVGGCFPTWSSTDAVMALTLYRDKPGGPVVATKQFSNVPDNGWLFLKMEKAQPKGNYYLEMSAAKGHVGWWTSTNDLLPEGQAYADGVPAAGDRNLKLVTTDQSAERVLSFFTFRKPQPDYFIGPTGPEQWGWLEVTPQHVFYKTPGVPEQVTVGVAQNALDGKLSALSNPRSHGRSFHDGRQPGPAGQDYTGRNFSEQWQRALKIDPPVIFVTGWNEWIAGRFDSKAPFYGSGPVTFVDQFSREYSRDTEPMKGGHGDAYYYQLISNIRRFKGVRPIEPVVSRPIRIDGQFGDWSEVRPEFRDDPADAVRRDHPGWGKGSRYANHTGRNDLNLAKVSWDASNVSFLIQTREAITPCTDPNWMLLFIDCDQNPTNGWMGYDFVLNRTVLGDTRTVLEKHEGQGYRWAKAAEADYRMAGNSLEVAIPRALLGLTNRFAVIDFKWADNIQQTGEWSDLTVNGDAAPNDRYNYRARLDLNP